MDANKYLTTFIAIVILVAVVSATAGTLLTNVTALNTTEKFSRVLSFGMIWGDRFGYAV